MSNIFYIFIVCSTPQTGATIVVETGDGRKVKQKRYGKRTTQYDPTLLGPRAEKYLLAAFFAFSHCILHTK